MDFIHIGSQLHGGLIMSLTVSGVSESYKEIRWIYEWWHEPVICWLIVCSGFRFGSTGNFRRDQDHCVIRWQRLQWTRGTTWYTSARHGMIEEGTRWSGSCFCHGAIRTDSDGSPSYQNGYLNHKLTVKIRICLHHERKSNCHYGSILYMSSRWCSMWKKCLLGQAAGHRAGPFHRLRWLCYLIAQLSSQPWLTLFNEFLGSFRCWPSSHKSRSSAFSGWRSTVVRFLCAQTLICAQHLISVQHWFVVPFLLMIQL